MLFTAWRHIVASAILIVGISAPTRADVLVVENEEQFREAAAELVRLGRAQYVEASRSIQPCYQGLHDACQGNMRMAIVKLATGTQLADTGGGVVKEFFLFIRNNTFLYERAYSLLLLNAIVQKYPPGACADYVRDAQRPLADGTVRSLAQHLQEAEKEIGTRTYLPEHRMLQSVRSLLRSCAAG
jgi:hypothetical protein